MFKREQIEQVRLSLDIVEVVREYVPSLKASGRSVKGLCPFHTEKTPSFFVHAEKGVFKCFGCGESGDVIAFLSKIESISFTEALEKLAARAGVVLKKDETPKQQESESLRDQLFRLLENALRYYEGNLWDSAHGGAARQYLHERGISEATSQKFRLGFAPLQKESAFETLVAKGFSVDTCRQAGLVARSQSGRFYDPLFGRLIFPIFDNFGHVVGFGGRTLPKTRKKVFGDEAGPAGEAPKYLNSPDSPVYSKGKLLYGLFQAKDFILKSRRVVIFEGYMDVVGAYEGGFREGVATLGTALTRDHTHLLRRYCDEVVAFFDSDEAGYQASIRGLEPILKEGLFPKVAVPKVKNDPDEIILQHGLEFFEEIVGKAPDFVDFILGINKSDSGSLKENAQLARSLVKLISFTPDQILKTEWMKRASASLGLEKESLQRELDKMEAVKNLKGELKEPEKSGILPSAEEELIELMMQVKGLAGDVDLEESELNDLRCRRIFGLIKRIVEEKGKVTIVGLIDDVEEADKPWLVQLSLEEKEFSDPVERKEQLVKSIRMQNDRKRLSQLNQLMIKGPVDEKLQVEYKELLKRVKGSNAVPILE